MRILPKLATVVFVGFIAALLIGLLAAFGTQYGLWNFQFGLYKLLPWCVYVGLAAVGLGIIWAITAAIKNDGAGALRGIVGLVGAAIVIAFPLYNAHLASISPPIHDITTDIVNPPQFRAILPLRKGATNSPDYYGKTDVTWNGKTKTVSQWQRKYYTDIHTVQVLIPPARLFARALKAARNMGWHIVAQSPNEGRIEATDTSFFFGFTDDIVIRVRPSGLGAKLDIRSESRVGKSDAGANAARIRAYIKELAHTRV